MNNLTQATEAVWSRYWNHKIDFTELLMHLKNIEIYSSQTEQQNCDHRSVEHMACIDCGKDMLDEYCLETDAIVSEMKGK